MREKNNLSAVIIIGCVLVIIWIVTFFSIIKAEPSITIRENSYIAHEITSECDNANIRYCKITYYENGTYRSCTREGYFLNPNKKDVKIYFKGDSCGTSMIGFVPTKIGVPIMFWFMGVIVSIVIFSRVLPLLKIFSSKK